MFWSKNKKSDKSGGKAPNTKKGAKETSVGKNAGQRPSSGDLRAQALANANAAREHIGQDTIDRIAAAMAKKQNSPTEQAKAEIADADADRVAQEILLMMDEKA